MIIKPSYSVVSLFDVKYKPSSGFQIFENSLDLRDKFGCWLSGRFFTCKVGLVTSYIPNANINIYKNVKTLSPPFQDRDFCISSTCVMLQSSVGISKVSFAYHAAINVTTFTQNTITSPSTDFCFNTKIPIAIVAINGNTGNIVAVDYTRIYSVSDDASVAKIYPPLPGGISYYLNLGATVVYCCAANYLNEFWVPGGSMIKIQLDMNPIYGDTSNYLPHDWFGVELNALIYEKDILQ